MPRLTYLLLLFFVLTTACSPEAVRLRQLKRYAKDLAKQPPVPPDTSTGAYGPEAVPELDMLDQLLRKYPGRQIGHIVTRTEIKTVPGKTVYVEVPVKADTARNRRERDALLDSLQILVQRERADSELRAEVARLRSRVLEAFNRRACLPDTIVRFPEQGLAFKVKLGANGRYGFTLLQAPQQFPFPVQVQENRHERVVYRDSQFWQFWQFWLATAGSVGFLWFVYRRLFATA